MNKTDRGFTYIELLVGMAMAVAIFIIATSLVINVYSSNLKSSRGQIMEQAKNDLQAEFGNTVRWADSISFVGGVLNVDGTVYSLKDGHIYKNSTPLTPDSIEVTSFDVAKYVVEQSSGDTGSGRGLTGQYFNTDNFHNYVFSQTDSSIDFNWGFGSPDDLIDPDTFSIRFTGQVEAPVTGTYNFYVGSDDGTKLWVGNKLLVDTSANTGFKEGYGSISMEAGKKYDVVIEYREKASLAELKLYWSYPGQSKEIVPTTRLYPVSGPVNLQISVDMNSKNNSSQVDHLKVILSPRGGSINAVEAVK